MRGYRLIVSVAAFGLLHISVEGADPIIQGYVFQLDKKTPIDNVNIEIYSTISGGASILIDSTTTDKSGFYKFDNLNANDSYDILYSHGKHENDVVSCLAETGQQQIRKYLYQKGQKPKSVTDLQQRIFAAKRLAMLTLTADKPGPALTEYSREVSMLKSDVLYPSDEKEFNGLLDELASKLPDQKSKAVKNIVKVEYASLREYFKAMRN